MTTMFVFGLWFYQERMAESGNIMWTIGLALMGIAFVVFILMHFYLYPLIVTFNVNFRQLYKNAFFLAMASFLPGLLILALNAALIYLIYIVFAASFQILLILVIGFVFSTIGLINNYFSYKYIKYHLLDPALAKAGQNQEDESESVFKDA